MAEVTWKRSIRYRVRTSKTHGRLPEEEMISPYFSTHQERPAAGQTEGLPCLVTALVMIEKSRKQKEFDLSGCGLEDTFREKPQSILRLKW